MEWAEVIENPLLQDLPFKIELNKWGKILMSPANNNHGNLQFEVGDKINKEKRSGKIIIECSIKTPEGVKVADVAWASDEFMEQYGYDTPYDVAPEICVEVISPSNRKVEMEEKIKLYLDQGAMEVWLCDQQGKISYYSSVGKLDKSGEVEASNIERIIEKGR
jgi:Uma2 family endonuclease